ncbi:MAG: restriction endonuclease [Chloroflexota bacterium]|nr:MAG: restriction endonuclease [Chloroflexota bacterium]
MGVFTWLDRFVSRVPLVVAIAMPLAVFLVADLAIQLITIQVWGGTGSLLRWQWSAIIVPLFAFIPGYSVAIVAVAAQMKRLGWWRLLDSNRSLDTVRSLPWREFERLVAAAFAAKGWSPELVGQRGPDGGTDLFLRKGKQRAIVQCKQRLCREDPPARFDRRRRSSDHVWALPEVPRIGRAKEW